MDKIWYFNPGDVACEDCKNAAGYYGKRPEGPHPGTCDCLIEEVTIDAIGSGCVREYRAVAAISSDSDGASTRYDFQNCSRPNTQASVECYIEVEDNLGAVLKGVMETQIGWTEPTHVTEGDFTAPANTRGTVSVQAVLTVTTGIAEEWEVCRKGTFVMERKLDDLSGSYTHVSAVQTDVDFEPCIR